MAFSGFYEQVAPWHDLPEQYRPWQTISGRFYRWGHSILQRLQQQADHSRKINWDLHFVDRNVLRTHQHAPEEGVYRSSGTFGKLLLNLDSLSLVI